MLKSVQQANFCCIGLVRMVNNGKLYSYVNKHDVNVIATQTKLLFDIKVK